jgi:hypothetical protein
MPHPPPPAIHPRHRRARCRAPSTWPGRSRTLLMISRQVQSSRRTHRTHRTHRRRRRMPHTQPDSQLCVEVLQKPHGLGDMCTFQHTGSAGTSAAKFQAIHKPAAAAAAHRSPPTAAIKVGSLANVGAGVDHASSTGCSCPPGNDGGCQPSCLAWPTPGWAGSKSNNCLPTQQQQHLGRLP